MYTINVSFKDILRIGTADSSFSVIWTSLVYGFLHLWRSPVRISFRSRVDGPLSFNGSLFLCRSAVTEPTSFAGPPFVHGSTDLLLSPVRFQFLCRSSVTEPTSFAGPPFVHGSSDLPRSPVRSSFRSGSTHLCRSPFPASSFLRRFSVPLSFPGPHHGFTDPSRSPFPTSTVLHRCPLPLLFISFQ